MSRHVGTERKINVIQGEYQVSNDPDVVLTTLLGSCVAACIFDPVAGVGGLNHFLLPGDNSDRKSLQQQQIGVHLMELLVNALMKAGANRSRLEAKIFGGARMMQGLSDIGTLNAKFATEFLNHEGIRIVGGDTGGQLGRRLQFWPVTGRARQSYMKVSEKEAVFERPAVSRPDTTGNVELF